MSLFRIACLGIAYIFFMPTAEAIKLKLKPFQSKERAARGRSCTDTCVYSQKVCGESAAIQGNRQWCMSKQANCDHNKKQPMKNQKSKITYRIQDYYYGTQTDWKNFFEDVCSQKPFDGKRPSSFEREAKAAEVTTPKSDIEIKFTAGLQTPDNMIVELGVFARMSYLANRESFLPQLQSQGWKVATFTGKAALAKAHIAGFVAIKGKKIVLAYHGTESMYDWLTDVKAIKVSAKDLKIPGNMHSGFHSAFMSSWPEVKRIIKKFVSEAGLSFNEIEYFVAGHSLGGALASIGGVMIAGDADLYPSKTLNSATNQVKVVTVAQPRVFETVAAAEYTKKMGNRNVLRFWIYGDPVPTLPYGTLGFKHVGTSIRMTAPEEFKQMVKKAAGLKQIATSIVGLHGAKGYVNLILSAYKSYRTNPVTHEGFKTKAKDFLKGKFIGLPK